LIGSELCRRLCKSAAPKDGWTDTSTSPLGRQASASSGIALAPAANISATIAQMTSVESLKKTQAQRFPKSFSVILFNYHTLTLIL
jgi:hypothetical protein